MHHLRGAHALRRHQGGDRVRHAAGPAQGRSGDVAEGGHERVAAAAADSRFAVDPQTPGPGRPPQSACVPAQCDQVAAAFQAGPTGVGSARVSTKGQTTSTQTSKYIYTNSYKINKNCLAVPWRKLWPGVRYLEETKRQVFVGIRSRRLGVRATPLHPTAECTFQLANIRSNLKNNCGLANIEPGRKQKVS